MNEAQSLFKRTAQTVVNTFARDTFLTSVCMTVSARFGLGPALQINLTREGDRLLACYGTAFTGSIGCFAASTPDELIATLNAEFIPALEKVSDSKIVVSGCLADTRQYMAACIGSESNPELSCISESVGRMLDAAARATLASVFADGQNFAQMSVTATAYRSADPTWVNVHRCDNDGTTSYCAETNDRDYMVGCPPSFYAEGDEQELLAAIMRFLTEEYLGADSVKVVVRGTAELEGDSREGELKPRVIHEIPV